MKERFERKWSKCGVVLIEEFICNGSMTGRLQRKWSQTGVVLTKEMVVFSEEGWSVVNNLFLWKYKGKVSEKVV